MTDGPDRYDLYELAAQSPDMQARFLRALHTAPDGAALTLGEDFCGAGAVSRAWLQLDPRHRAVCVDREPEPLHRLRAALKRINADAAQRATIHQHDAAATSDPADLICALNFSICELRTRDELLRYLRAAHARLRPRGVLTLDIYGGADAFITGESDRELRDGLRYVWEQRDANPLTGEVVNAMHFFLPDGRQIRDAFVYRWRLWSPPELRDALLDVGFASVEAHNRLGDAVDDSGRLYLRPIESPHELDDTFVIYLAARTAH